MGILYSTITLCAVFILLTTLSFQIRCKFLLMPNRAKAFSTLGLAYLVPAQAITQMKHVAQVGYHPIGSACPFLGILPLDTPVKDRPEDYGISSQTEISYHHHYFQVQLA